MNPPSLDRRNLMIGAFALGGTSVLMLDTPTLEASPQVAERLNLHDPASRAHFRKDKRFICR